MSQGPELTSGPLLKVTLLAWPQVVTANLKTAKTREFCRDYFTLRPKGLLGVLEGLFTIARMCHCQ